MKYRSRGFTLLELMVVLTLAAVILAIATPSFNNFRRNSRLTAVANDYLGSMQTARSEAIKRQLSVSMCPSDNPDATSPTCSTGTFRGWFVFVDQDSDCVLDTGERVVRIQSRIDGSASTPIYPVSNGICISFASSGFRQNVGSKDTASRTVFCDSRGNTEQDGTEQSTARGIEVTPTGRARVTREVGEIAAWSLTCPSS